MTRPSRLMPQIKEVTVNPYVEWLIVAIFTLPFLYLVWIFPYILLLTPFVFFYERRERHKLRNHYQLLIQDRKDDSICTFARYFDCKQVDTWVVRAVYEQLENYLKSEQGVIPVRATDDVFSDLKIDEEDFELDIVEEIAQRTGRSLEKVEDNPYYGKANIVENLVYLFNEQPKIKS